MPPQQPRTGRIIHLFVWLATVVPTASAQTNLLRGILPSTSTSYRPSSFKPAYLTDGVKTGNYWHSWADKTPSKMLWAKVALRSRYIITRITVYNRCDSCCNERMEDIRMYVGDSKTGKEQLCGIFGYTGSCKSASLYCNLEGDFVIMRLHTSWTRHDVRMPSTHACLFFYLCLFFPNSFSSALLINWLLLALIGLPPFSCTIS